MCRFKGLYFVSEDKPTCFNTSYVSVQANDNSYAPSFGTGFNTSYVSVQVMEFIGDTLADMFQYILCVGSRWERQILM